MIIVAGPQATLPGGVLPGEVSSRQQTDPAAAGGRSQGLQLVATGFDGSSWDLTSGPVRVTRGLSGLLDPDAEHVFMGGRAAGRLTRLRLNESQRAVTFSVAMESSSSLGMRDLLSAWSQAVASDGPATLTAYTPDGGSRSCSLWRTSTQPGSSFDMDPLYQRSYVLDHEFVADGTWAGQTIRQPFYVVTPPDLYPIGPLEVGASDTTAAATITNPGHVPVWPVYTATGPMSGFTVGVGASLIQYGPVAAGASVFIDTHPDRQTVGTTPGDNSEAAWLGLVGRDFSPVPPGQRVPIVVDMTSPLAGASVAVELTPEYRRAL